MKTRNKKIVMIILTTICLSSLAEANNEVSKYIEKICTEDFNRAYLCSSYNESDLRDASLRCGEESNHDSEFEELSKICIAKYL